MDRPRVILAETDMSYLHPLMFRFAEKYGDKVALEIVDDPEYFRRLFSSPQRADVLVVSETLYDPGLRIHNLGHVFVLTEEMTEAESDSGPYTAVFKYSNIIEVFNRISAPISPAEERGETKLIVVTSANGGTGKTTLALGICGCLSKYSKSVLYINAAHLQSFQHFFVNKSPIANQEVYAKLIQPGKTIYQDIQHVVRREQFSYLPAFKMALLSLGLSYSVFEKIAVSAKEMKAFDYIVVDAENGLSEENARLIGLADRVVFVMRQGRTSAFATSRMIANINGSSSGKFFFICNDFDRSEENTLVGEEYLKTISVNDYVEHMDRYDRLQCEDFAKSEAIQRTAVLVM